MSIPNIDATNAQLGIQLTEVVVRNAAPMIFDRIRAIKSKKSDQEKISELEQIIYNLIDDKSELATIAQAYKEQLVAQQISDDDITYIVDTVVPALKELVEKTQTGNAEAARQLDEGIDLLTPLLSAEMLTVLQLVGFNFKKAIGEPLTFLLQKFIASKMPVNPRDDAEFRRVEAEFSVELAKIAQNKAATDRWERLRDFRAGS